MDVLLPARSHQAMCVLLLDLVVFLTPAEMAIEPGLNSVTTAHKQMAMGA